ncbi:hypothetical protein [Stygiobacter electus]|uniref:Antibiotic biosynthesis monooxygenase n=1 Tax=Stygiobacter electus TaxID=3032292 RepID=A0AAE3TFA2_9BACT|nr:hypothetical protein [Stygiobacter electus]MDF1613277.1 hypothetical protein [Stygiobacter electus]
MIARIWHGWTTSENADVYESLLKTEIFSDIAQKNISGYKGIQLLRRIVNEETEFVTIMLFNSIEDVKEFAGENYTIAYVTAKDRKVLKRFDEHSQHYEVREKIEY